MSNEEQRFPDDDGLGLVAALRRAATKNAKISKAMSEGQVTSRLFNVPKELPVDWTYVEATALVTVIRLGNPKTRQDIHKIASQALPKYTPQRAARIAEACIRWGASL